MSNRNNYTVGWICAIATEHVAAKAFLDKKHDDAEDVPPTDNNIYTLGQVGKHNVVISMLPDGEYGIAAAASVARDMLHSFPNIRIGLMVGIGGGAPSSKHDIRLGDVIVSAPRNGQGGVFQYDFGKTIQDQEFQNTKFLDQPPTLLRNAVSSLKSHYESDGHQFQETINTILEKFPRLRKKYQQPKLSTDRLYRSEVVHPSDSELTCAETCGNSELKLVSRLPRAAADDNPVVHYGLIASANQLMKDALVRDRLASEKGVLCFEMEAAGLMTHFPCLVIRGICDYSDSHKNKDWQGYAAMTAAAYAKDLLQRIPPNKVKAERQIIHALSGVKEGIDRLLHIQHDQEHVAILDWLTPVDYGPQQSDHLQRQQEGTGTWLLDSEQFQKWLEGENQTLFCPGIPGAGKTVLTSIVVNHLHSKFQDDPQTGLAYIYFNYKRLDEQTIDALLASLLKQLAASQFPLPKAVQTLYGKHKIKRTRPSVDEFSKAVQSVAAMYSKVFVVMDALDECRIESRTSFLSSVFQLRRTARAYIFTTSRFISDIEDRFTGALIQEIRATGQDIYEYISAHVNQLPSCVQDNRQLQEEIISGISEAVDGMFLLAQIYVQSLDDKFTPSDIRDALRGLNKQNLASTEYQKTQVLNSAYDKAVERVNGQKEGLKMTARRALFWITCAKRPLTTTELQHALAVKPGETVFDEDNLTHIKDIVSACAGLVTVDNKTNIIRLVHYTTQEYFQQTHKKWFLEPQSEITTICVTYLSYKDFEGGACNSDKDFEARLESYPFYNYASHYWGNHAREVPATRQNVIELLEDVAKVESSCQALMAQKECQVDPYYSARFTRRMTGLHLAAYFGVIEAVDQLLRGNVANIEAADEDGGTPLCWAARNGHEAVVELLLDNGANIEAAKKYYGTSLCMAACNGHEAIVQLLLDKGANVRAANHYGETSLYSAALNGYETIVRLLLDNSPNIEAANHFGETSLYSAALKGYESIVQLLLDNGANTEAANVYGQTSLDRAACNGNVAMVQLFLENGADIEAADKHDETPLYSAARTGREAVVRLLLDKGANVRAANHYGVTPLSQATRNGHEAIVRLLLDKGADIEAADEVWRDGAI